MITDKTIENKIYELRGERVMLDRDLAVLFGVETKRLKEQVRRNIERFPPHFMFELTEDEVNSLRSQFATLKRGEHSKYNPFAFTEHGVLMLANVLRSKQAIQMSIKIIEVFVKLREIIDSKNEILNKIDKLERQSMSHDKDIQVIFDLLRKMVQEPPKERPKIGYKLDKN